MTTDLLNLSSYDELTVDFSFVCISMESGEDFWLQASVDGGSTWQTLTTWTSGVDFSNGTRYNPSIVITGTFGSNFRLRMRCDAGNNGDRVYIDDMNITGCNNAARLDAPVAVDGEMQVVDQQIVEIFGSMDLFPNPTSDNLTVQFELIESSEVEVMITDLTGKVMQRQFIQRDAGSHQVKVDVSDLTPGMYLMHLINRNDNVSKKFVVTR
jgi:hypothetical protein